MISVSDAFKTAVKAPVRRFVPRLQIAWTDALIDPTIVVTASEENYIQNRQQTADGILLSSQKWAHLDGVIKADGTYHPMPSPAERATAQMGWYGANACNGSAQWSAGSYPTLTIVFDARPVVTLVVHGDSIYNEYPVDFDVVVTDTIKGTYTKTVTGNFLLYWSADISSQALNSVTQMDLVIKKWSAPNRVAKITEFYTSLVATYIGDDIVSMNLLEERELSDGSVPIGNISANELDIELQNVKLVDGTLDPFSYDNDNSLLENVLKINRRIIASLGLVLPDKSVEYVSLGTFWSGDWNAKEKDPSVSTAARDRMELLRKAEFAKSLIYSGITLYDLMEIVLNSAMTDIPMPDLSWIIDAELADFIIPIAYFPRQSYFKCIQEIVEACMGNAYVSRADVLIIQGPSFAGGTAETYLITRDDYFDRAQPAKSEELLNLVRIPITAIAAQTSTSEVYRSQGAVTIAAGADIVIDADYSSYPASDVSGVLEGASADVAISAEEYYACTAKVTVHNSSGTDGSFVLVLSGTAYDSNSDEIIENSDADSIKENGTLKYEYSANHLMQTREIGIQIAAKLLATYKTFRKDANVTWRGNPSLELGDKIDVPIYQHPHKSPYDVDKHGTFYIYKNEMDFDGTLKATTDGRKIS